MHYLKMNQFCTTEESRYNDTVTKDFAVSEIEFAVKTKLGVDLIPNTQNVCFPEE